MRLSFTQELRQEQRQVMTPQMIQSMEILQLAQQQLEQRIDQELEQNPVLELDEDSEDTLSESGNSEEDRPSTVEHEPELNLEHTGTSGEFSIADEFAQNYSDTIDEAPIRSQNWLEDQGAFISDAFANIASPSESLQTYLERQLDWFDLDEPTRELALLIINNLETNGYFTQDLADLLGGDHTQETLENARRALEIVKRLEPAGVGAKDIRECLLLQVNSQSEYADVLRILISSCLEDISANRLPVIAKRIGYPLEVVQGAVAELRHFNPRPGAGFGSEAAGVVIPDIFVEKTETGKYIVRLEDGRTPQLRISKFYKDLMNKQCTDEETREYIKQKAGSARWLLSAIEQRRETLFKVSQAIVDYQAAFFDKGQQALKPLKMQQIADVVGMHVTTVSRACDDKWIASPRGVFPLRRLFVGGLTASGGGDDVAGDVVRLKLQEIIGKEDKKDPLSDDALVKILESEGIQVARRTIVKYRQHLGIPSSRGRRQWDV